MIEHLKKAGNKYYLNNLNMPNCYLKKFLTKNLSLLNILVSILDNLTLFLSKFIAQLCSLKNLCIMFFIC